MPTLIRMPKDHQQQVQQQRQAKNGFQLGCFRICTCMHPGFIMSKSGMLKVFEILLGSCLETLLINFGAREMSATAFQSCLTTVSACLSTTFILCLCYTLSAKSFYLIRQSMFELIFNGLACFLYIGAACYMGFMSKMPTYRNMVLFSFNNTMNPALSCIYYMGTVLAVIYAADTIVAFKYYRDSSFD